MTLWRFPIETRDGAFTAWFSERGLARLDFPSSRRPGPDSGRTQAPPPPQVQDWCKRTAAALNSTLANRAPGPLPPLDWASATAFQQKVWSALLRIGPGRTRSYAQIAAEIDRPAAARAVGGACGANPIPVLVPCHRVLAAGGKLGGFSGGLSWKKRLLAREGALPEEAQSRNRAGGR